MHKTWVGYATQVPGQETALRKPNYSYEKRQREIAKQKKRDAKRLKKSERVEPDEEQDANRNNAQ